MNAYHQYLLKEIRKHSGKPTQHNFLNGYLGNDHPIYPIGIPKLRQVAKAWMKDHREMKAVEFKGVLTSLIQGKSSTEKCLAGILLDLSKTDQRKFSPAIFNSWLNHLVGWAEIDTLCTNSYAATEIPEKWKSWKPLLTKLAKDKNLNKKRASLVLLCTPLRKSDDPRLATFSFQQIDRLCHHKEIIITKAVSWVLRSAVGRHKGLVKEYLTKNAIKLPSIAVRETKMKLETGRKGK